jgi:hypothetical protein
MLLAAAVQATAEAEEVIPTAVPVGRYTVMREHCPFAIATPVAAPAPQQPSFAANWYVSGIARVGDVDFVGIKAKDLSSQFSLYGKEPDAKSGVSLVSIDWVEGIGKSVVTIQKGTEIAKLEFNEAVVHGPPQNPVAPNAAPNGRPPAMAIVPPPGPLAKPVPVPNGYDPTKFPRAALVPGKTPAGQNGMQPMAKGPYAVPGGASKPMTPYPHRSFIPANQAPH